MAIGTRGTADMLRSARKVAGLSQVEAARICKVSPLTVSRRERGVVDIGLGKLNKVLALFKRAGNRKAGAR